MNMLGLDFLKGHKLAFATMGFVALTVSLLGFYLWRNSQKISDKIHADYLRFCKKLAKKGLKRIPTEGPQDYLERICHRRPDIAPIATQIIKLYITLRYGETESKKRHKSLHRMISNFRP
jgi:hypothetical protein